MNRQIRKGMIISILLENSDFSLDIKVYYTRLDKVEIAK